MYKRQLKAPAVCFYNAAALSLFASGRTRGLVLDVGASVSKAVPVFEGFGIAHALTTSKRAGAAVTAVLAEKMGLGHDDARRAKEKACAFGAPEDVEVELPDGTVVSVDAAARAREAARRQGDLVLAADVVDVDVDGNVDIHALLNNCLLYTSPSPRDAHESRMPSSA